MNSSFTASAYLVKTERSHAPAKRASFANPYDSFDPEGSGYASQHPSGTGVLNVRTEKKNIARKRFRPPGDGRVLRRAPLNGSRSEGSGCDLSLSFLEVLSVDTSSRRIRQSSIYWAVEKMKKMRVVGYLDEDQLEGLEWHKRTSISEVVGRAIGEFLKRQAGYQNRRYDPDNPPGRKPRWRRTFSP